MFERHEEMVPIQQIAYVGDQRVNANDDVKHC